MSTTNFTEALNTGRVVVRRVSENTNGKDGQVNVQFMQLIENTIGTANPLLAIAQGFQKSKVTSVQSWAKEAAFAKGLTICDYSSEEVEKIFFAGDIFGIEPNIQVEENFTPNAYAKNHEPKINPATGEVIKFNDKAVYRHTSLVLSEPKHGIMTQERANVLTSVTENGSVKLAESKVEQVATETFK